MKIFRNIKECIMRIEGRQPAFPGIKKCWWQGFLYADNDIVVKLKESGKKEEKRTTTPPTAKEWMSWSKCSVGCIECDEQLSTGWKRNHTKIRTIFVGLLFVARCSGSEMDLTIMILLWRWTNRALCSFYLEPRNCHTECTSFLRFYFLKPCFLRSIVNDLSFSN